MALKELLRLASRTQQEAVERVKSYSLATSVRLLPSSHNWTIWRLNSLLPALREMANISGVAGDNIRALLGQLEGQLG